MEQIENHDLPVVKSEELPVVKSEESKGFDLNEFKIRFKQLTEERKAIKQKMRLENKTTTLKNECAKEGLDYRAVLKQAKIEKDLMDSYGLTMQDVSKTTTQKGILNEKES